VVSHCWHSLTLDSVIEWKLTDSIVWEVSGVWIGFDLWKSLEFLSSIVKHRRWLGKGAIELIDWIVLNHGTLLWIDCLSVSWAIALWFIDELKLRWFCTTDASGGLRTIEWSFLIILNRYKMNYRSTTWWRICVSVSIVVSEVVPFYLVIKRLV
jgi:hypothetical protein